MGVYLFFHLRCPAETGVVGNPTCSEAESGVCIVVSGQSPGGAIL